MKYSFSARGGEVNVGYDCFDTAPTKLSESHCHEKFEILYIIRGGGKYNIEGTEYNVAPRTLMLIRPFAYHHLILDELPYERYVVHFSKNSISADALRLLENMMITEDEDKQDNGNYFSPALISDPIISVFDRFRISESLPEEERTAYVKTLISELVILLSAVSGEKMLLNDYDLGASVVRYINYNLCRNLSLDRIARYFFVSKFHLCRAFKSYTGVSLHAYVTHKRIVYAKQLIESGERASDVAYKIGFGDYSAFYRAYLKIVGASPTANKTNR